MSKIFSCGKEQFSTTSNALPGCALAGFSPPNTGWVLGLGDIRPDLQASGKHNGVLLIGQTSEIQPLFKRVVSELRSRHWRTQAENEGNQIGVGLWESDIDTSMNVMLLVEELPVQHIEAILSLTRKNAQIVYEMQEEEFDPADLGSNVPHNIRQILESLYLFPQADLVLQEKTIDTLGHRANTDKLFHKSKTVHLSEKSLISASQSETLKTSPKTQDNSQSPVMKFTGLKPRS